MYFRSNFYKVNRHITIALFILSFAVWGISPAQVNLTNGLVAHYDFTGDATDLTGNGNNGTVNGATLRTDRGGNAASCYEFDAVNNNIVVPNSSSFDFPTNRMSISFWFQVCEVPVGTKERYMISKMDYMSGPANTGWHIYFRKEPDSTLMLWYRLVNGDPTNPGGFYENLSAIQTGIWYHAVFIVNATHIQHYLNNVYMGQWPRVNALVPNNRPLVFGGGTNVWNPLSDLMYGPGRLDDIRIYNRVINAQEVNALYNLIPSATINPSITLSTNNALCLNIDSLVLSGSNHPGYTYIWNTPAGNQVTGNPAVIQNPSNAYAGTYTVTPDNEGCTRAPLTINVTPAIPDLVLTAPAQVCLGNPFNVTTPAVPGATFNWSAPGAGTPNANQFSVGAATINEEGNYSLTYSLNGCLGESDTVQVAIVNQYQITLFDTICQGQTLFVGGAAQGSTGAYQDMYQSVSGCDSLVTTELFVKPLPQVSLGPDQQSCVGTPVTLTAQTNGTLLTWSDNSNGPSITVSTTGAYWFEAELDGCTARDTAIVTFYLNPPADFTANANAQCLTGNSFSFSPNTNYAPGTIFDWTFQNANTPTSGVQNPSGIIWDASGTFQVSLVVTENNCVSTPATLNITVYPMPNADFTALPTEGCMPVQVKFNDASTSNSTFASTWNFGDGNTGTENSPVHVYPDPGNYTVSLSITDENGCSDTEVKTNFITVYPQPVAGFSLADENLTTTIPLLNVSNEALLSENCLYYLNTGEAWTDCSFSDMIVGTGTYQITQIVTSGAGCTDSLSKTFTIRPVPEIFIPNSFTPDDDFINERFEISMSWISDFYLIIYDRWGTIVYETPDLFSYWNGRFMNNGKEVPQGLYAYKIRYRPLGQQKDYFVTGSVNLIR